MRTVGIVHHSLNSVGGGEHLSLTLAEALKEAGYRVAYYTTQPTDWEYVRIMTGIMFRPDEERSVFRLRIPMFGIYQRLLTGLLARAIKADVTVNTHGDAVPLASADVVYMHYPAFSLWYEDPANVKYLRSTFWKAYFAPYYAIQRSLVRSERYGLVLTNSEFSREAIKKYVGRDALVVHPPARLGDYLALPDDEREDLVVSIGRFTPEKRYEDALRIATRVKGARFAIVGSTSGKIGPSYLAKLRRMAKELKADNVEFYPNATYSTKLELLRRAKAYLHCMRNEHFGIAVVEGMASGCVPVVHRSGGPWTDILCKEQGAYGFAYQTVEEAAQIIEGLVTDDATRKEVARRARERSRAFSDASFKARMLEIVERVLQAKQSAT